jgi:hypothetical protein
MPDETAPDPSASPEFYVLKLTNLKLIACRDREEMQDAVRALRERAIGYIVLRWNAQAQTYTQPEIHE